MSVICGIEDRLYSSFEKEPPPLQGGQSRGWTVTQGVALGWSPPRRWREFNIEWQLTTNSGGRRTGNGNERWRMTNDEGRRTTESKGGDGEQRTKRRARTETECKERDAGQGTRCKAGAGQRATNIGVDDNIVRQAGNYVADKAVNKQRTR
jgi:hypothetical protein